MKFFLGFIHRPSYVKNCADRIYKFHPKKSLTNKKQEDLLSCCSHRFSMIFYD